MYRYQFNPITRQLNLVNDAIDLGSAFKGVYDSETVYASGDAVLLSGKIFICLQAGTGHDPLESPTWWDELDLQGPVGLSGDAGGRWFHVSGPNDPDNTDPGGDDGDHCLKLSDGSVWNRESGIWVDTGGILKGATGAQGIQGVQGPTGPVGSGDVYKATSSTVDHLVIFGNTTGDLLKESGVPLKAISPISTAPISSSGAITLNMALGRVFTTTLTENITSVTLSNPPASGICGTVTWIVTQHASSAKTIALPTGGVWATGTAPDFSTLNAVYVLIFKTVNAGSSWVVSSAGGGGGLSGLTAGGLLIGGTDGKATQDATKLVWVNGKLGVGTNSPNNLVSVVLSSPASTELTQSASSATIVNGYAIYPPTFANLKDLNFGSGTNGYIYSTGSIAWEYTAELSFTRFDFYSVTNDVSRAKNFKLECFGGSGWFDIDVTGITGGTGSGTNLVANNVNGWVSCTFGAVTGTKIRLVLSSTWSGNLCGITELQVFGYTGFNSNVMDLTLTGLAGFGTPSPSAKVDINNTSDSLSLKAYRAGTTVTDAIATFHSDVGSTGATKCKIMVDGDLENTNNSYGAI
ncbi:MAG: hypothetical protein HQL93_13725, partial [Magnetococcales bacterium]|nr:hypothetical protein [Magnetococcales bacterium]